MKLQIFEGLLKSRKDPAGKEIPPAALPYIEQSCSPVDEPKDLASMPEEKRRLIEKLNEKYQTLKRFKIKETHKNSLFLE